MLKIETQHMPEEAKNAGAVWEYLFKINQLLLPMVIIWAAWATSNIYELKGFADTGPRFTATDADNQLLTMKEWVREHYVQDGPAREMAKDIKQIIEELDELKLSLAKAGIGVE